MKLLELLVKERIGSGWVKPWSEIKQNGVGEILITKNAVTVKLEGHEGLPIADDWQTAIVTKDQYDNACKLVDDGYTLWFGGECPVQGDSIVSVAWLYNDQCGKFENMIASDFNWAKPDATLAYKVVGEKPVSIEIIRKPFDFTSVADVVNHPSHYTNGKVECIDAIESATVGKTGIEAVCVANVIKYLWRYEDKNGLEDIKKAQWYLNKLIEVKK